MPDTTAASLLTVEIEHTGGAAVVRCHGKLVYGATDVLYSKVRALLPDNRRIVLDLTDLARMDSMGLGTLARLYVSARSAGCELELMNLGKQVRQLLATTNMLAAFTIVGEQGIRLG